MKKKHRLNREFSRNFGAFFDDVIFFFENLKNLHNKSLIVVKKIIKIFAQIFKTFQYLYSRDVTYRNLKLKNILIKFRSFLCIKLADFNFTNDKLDLKIVCDTQ